MAGIMRAMPDQAPELRRPIPRLPAVAHPAAATILKRVVGERSVELCRDGKSVLPPDFGAGRHKRQIPWQCHAFHGKRRTRQRQETDIDGGSDTKSWAHAARPRKIKT